MRSLFTHGKWRLLGAALLVLASSGGVTALAANSASAASCAAIDVVVARGTFEPGTLGSIVGDPVYAAIKQDLSSTTTSSYPVNYPADLNEPASVQAGNTDLVNHLNSQAAACPNQRFVLVGYSQAANVVDYS